MSLLKQEPQVDTKSGNDVIINQNDNTVSNLTEIARIRSVQKILIKMKSMSNEQLMSVCNHIERDNNSGSAESNTNITNSNMNYYTAKRNLLNHLAHTSYVKLAASKIHGIGVIVMKNIGQNIDPFWYPNKKGSESEDSDSEDFKIDQCLEISDLELQRTMGSSHDDEEVLKHIKSFFAALTEDDGVTLLRSRTDGSVLYGVNSTGLNTLDLSWYLNHSDTPNLKYNEAVNDGTFCTYTTLREIKKGEELTIDYRELGMSYYEMIIEE